MADLVGGQRFADPIDLCFKMRSDGDWEAVKSCTMHLLSCGSAEGLGRLVDSVQKLPSAERSRGFELVELVFDGARDADLVANCAAALFMHGRLRLSEPRFRRLLGLCEVPGSCARLHPAIMSYAIAWWIATTADRDPALGELGDALERLSARDALALAALVNELSAAAEKRCPKPEEFSALKLAAALLLEADSREGKGQRSTAALLRSAVSEHRLGFVDLL